MKRILTITLAALSLLAPAHAVLAADKTPLASYPGEPNQPLKAGDTVPVAHGGTGATTGAGARTNLGAAASGANADITSLSGMTTPLSVGQGGTGAITLTTHCVLVGVGTSAVHLVCPSTSGYVLTDNGASADPSFQPAAGGSGSPGGSSGQLQYNNAGAFGGFTLGGDCSFSVPNVTCTKTGGVSFAASATTDTTNAANIGSGTLPAARLPNPSASTLGGVESLNVASHKWLNTISTAGVPAATQPACGDLSDAVSLCSSTDAANLTGTLSASRIAASSLVLSKIANASANSVLVGSGAAGSGAAYGEISLGTGLTMTGTTLSAIGGSGTVTTTGSPASGNLAKFSGSTSVTNGDLSGDVTTSGTLATTLASSGVSAGSYGSGTAVPVLTVDAKGRVTSASTAPVGSSGAVGAEILLSEVVTSGSQASVTFSSIAGSYRDLVVRVRGRNTSSNTSTNPSIQLNGDTGANYVWENFNANSTTINASQNTSATAFPLSELPAATATANHSGYSQVVISDYRGTTFYKSIYAEGGRSRGTGANSQLVQFFGGNWANTAAVTSLKVMFDPGAGSFVDGSVVSLYGRY